MSFRDKFFSGYYPFMADALDGLAIQQEAIANNIANANNPDYHPVRVSFQDQLKQMLAEDNQDQNLKIKLDFDPEFHAEGVQAGFHPEVSRDPKGHVDVSQEMAQLAKTQILFNICADNVKPSWNKFVIESLMR